MDLEQGAGLKLNRDLIPDSLQAFIPCVEKWGFESLDEQDQFVELMLRERPDEVKAFNDQVDQAHAQIIEWGKSLTEFDKNRDDFEERDWNHPYWAFLATLKVREVTGQADAAEFSDARARMSAEARLYRFNEALSQAVMHFQRQEYREYVTLMDSYQDLMSPAQKKKYDFARRKITSETS